LVFLINAPNPCAKRCDLCCYVSNTRPI